MAYSGAVQVMLFEPAGNLVSATTAQINIGTDTVASHMIVPVPLMIYAFGVYITQTLGASYDGSLLLRKVTIPGGTNTTLSTLDLDSVLLKSGDNTKPFVTASTGAEDIVAGDAVFAPASAFPVLVQSPTTLHMSFTANSDTVGEAVPFIVARWQGMDLRQTEIWMAE